MSRMTHEIVGTGFDFDQDINHEPPVGDNVILPVTLHTEGVDYKLGMKKPSPLKEWSIPR